MGGTKNKSPAQKEKSQADSKASSQSKRPKKDEKKEGGAPKAEITVLLTEEQASRFIKSAKVITVQELARSTGVKISTASAFLAESVQKGTVEKVGGYSGHYVYRPVSA